MTNPENTTPESPSSVENLRDKIWEIVKEDSLASLRIGTPSNYTRAKLDEVIQQHTQEVLEGERERMIQEDIERMEGMKKSEKVGKYCKYCGEEIGYDRAMKEYFCGTCPMTSSRDKTDLIKTECREFNQAIDDLITYKKSLLTPKDITDKKV